MACEAGQGSGHGHIQIIKVSKLIYRVRHNHAYHDACKIQMYVFLAEVV